MNHKDNFHVTVNHKLSKKQVNWRRLRRGKPSECSFQLLVAAVQCGLYFALEESTRTSSFHSKMKMALFANMDAITGLPVLDGTRSAFHHARFQTDRYEPLLASKLLVTIEDCRLPLCVLEHWEHGEA